MTEVPISDSALRGLWADYTWYTKDPVSLQNGRLELLCSRIGTILAEYKAKQHASLDKDPYGDYL